MLLFRVNPKETAEASVCTIRVLWPVSVSLCPFCFVFFWIVPFTLHFASDRVFSTKRFVNPVSVVIHYYHYVDPCCFVLFVLFFFFVSKAFFFFLFDEVIIKDERGSRILFESRIFGKEKKRNTCRKTMRVSASLLIFFLFWCEFY